MKLSPFFLSLVGSEKKRNTKELISLPDLEIVFILSAGRTGTHFLHHFFNTCFTEVYAVHEPYPDLFDLGMEKIRKNKPTHEVVDSIRHHRNTLLKKAQKENHTTYIESNPHAIYLIPEIKAVFPRVRFLHLVRDPKEAVRSLYQKVPIKDGGGMFFYGNNDHRKRICPADFPGDKHVEDWKTFNRLQKIAWYWNKANSIIIKDLIGIGDGMTLKYEDLFSRDLPKKKRDPGDDDQFSGVGRKNQTGLANDRKLPKPKDQCHQNRTTAPI